MSLHLALTGGSSFTAMWIALELLNSGYRLDVLCPRASLSEYEGLKKKRLETLIKHDIQVHFGIRAENSTMRSWVEKHKPQAWIHHHHWMDDYRSAGYDLNKAEVVGIRPLKELMETLSRNQCQKFLYSGSFFEPGEGGAFNTNPTPYSVSKAQVWEKILEIGCKQSFSISKIVIPNPIGPLEQEQRLIPSLVEHARAGKVFKLQNEQSVSDNLPVRELAKAYRNAIESSIVGQPAIHRPSGFVATTKQIIDSLNQELLTKRLNVRPCVVELQVPLGPRAVYVNSEKGESVNMDIFWDEYAYFLKTGTIEFEKFV